MKNIILTRTVTSGVVLAALVGFSGTSLAQSEAIESMNAQQTQLNTFETVEHHATADQLSAALDQFNTQDRASEGLQTQSTGSQAPQQVSRVANRLSNEIDAYNADASSSLVPETHAVASESNHKAMPIAQQLASELTTYNRTGGSSRY